ncbi:MAG: transcriptional repressor LexA [Deltaproteobacteria bacterium]|nr:transcriptional repressor LexA [Deltaproteobacteria bacterium]
MSRTPTGQTRERIYRFVAERLRRGDPPTIREIQRAMGLGAVEVARRHLENLVREGRLQKTAGAARGYRLPPESKLRSRRLPGIPLLGAVQAGALTTAFEDPEGWLPASPAMPPGEFFALRVRGESMTGAGIRPGDIAVVRRQERADSGDIVVALVEDEATVKRLRVRSGRVELLPENPEFAPIRLAADEVRILGKVIEIRRYLEAIPFVES